MNKKPINADKSDLTEKTETNPNLQTLKLIIDSESLSTKIYLVKVILKIGQEKYLTSTLF